MTFPPDATAPHSKSRLAIVLTGGGARAAYQVGLLRGIAARWPDLEIEILSGVSAGAINVSHLAAHPGDFRANVDALTELWLSLTPEKVFNVDALSLLSRMARAILKFGSGGSRLAPETRGMVDTRPLAEFLRNALGTDNDSPIPGIIAKLQGSTALDSVALGTIDWATGRGHTWIQAREPELWRRSGRESRQTELTLQHVMASSALPLLFPAVQLGDSWHGDGGVRLIYPLAPAVHSQADRILAISTRTRPPGERTPDTVGYPPTAQVAGVLMNAIFLDQLDQDAQRLERINHLLHRTAAAPDPREGQARHEASLRHIDLCVVRPSEDLGRLAAEYEFKLPRAFRFATRGLGTKETKSPDILAMLMFQPDYVQRLIEVGERDAESNHQRIARTLRR